MGLGLLGGELLGPARLFILLVGFCLVIAVIFVYCMGNAGVVVHYWRHRRGEFTVLAILPESISGLNPGQLVSSAGQREPEPAAPAHRDAESHAAATHGEQAARQ